MINKDRLNKLSTREIAAEARGIIETNSYAKAKVLLQDHIEVANIKLQDFAKRVNKELGTHKSPPQIRVITDFLRFK